MRQILILVTALTLIATSAARPAAQSTAAANRPATAKARIGVFDSRLVALAYYRTPGFQAETKQMMTDLAAAKAAGNTARIEALEFQGPAIQSLMHYQVFSTASIPNVLDTITAALPKVAADAGVSAIVSRWEIAFRNADVEYVDVTDQLVRLFNPNATLLQMIAQAKSQPPMPLLEAVKTLRPDR